MRAIKWNQPEDRIVETGLDRGVLYPKSKHIAYSTTGSALNGSMEANRTFALSPSMSKPFKVGRVVKVEAGPVQYMIGIVVASSPSSVTLDITNIVGAYSETLLTDWTLTESLVVPWNGLTSVEEGGGEGAVTYYVDGRPFLHLPTPKEFTATINAYTYPDEFSVITGMTEATDGMYLDSQIGESFDLSYRTLVGSAADSNVGYKIHLIYNATVVPSAVSHVTSGDSVNPVEFSWEVQAVPVQVEGYRATAHITIDTRNIDPEKLIQIEEMLYGVDGGNPPVFPTAQQLFDVITYGDTIVIVDNEDGTWEAIGAYENIYMIGDGIFQIDNVNATDNGDGTYYISSTP